MAIPPDQSASGGINTTVTKVTPTSGQNVTVVNDGGNQILSLRHTVALAALTITFPAAPNATEIIEIATTGAVTALTLAAAGMTIMNVPAQLAAGDYLSFRYIGDNTWMRRI